MKILQFCLAFKILLENKNWYLELIKDSCTAGQFETLQIKLTIGLCYFNFLSCGAFNLNGWQNNFLLFYFEHSFLCSYFKCHYICLNIKGWDSHRFSEVYQERMIRATRLTHRELWNTTLSFQQSSNVLGFLFVNLNALSTWYWDLKINRGEEYINNLEKKN